MASELRTLKLQLLADTEDFIKGLKKAETNTSDFSDKIGGYLKVGAAAFIGMAAAAGTAAIAIGIDAVKAAAADEDATNKLNLAIKNITKATDSQVKSVNDYIDATELATGVTDDQLRPSFERLLRSTKDITQAQKLQKLALDISAGTSKDLAIVTEGLSKLYDGNFAALKKLGIPLDENIVKTKDYDAAIIQLSDTFAGQAQLKAESFEGQILRLQAAFNQTKEELGKTFLPMLTQFISVINESIVPAVKDFVNGLTGDTPESMKNAIRFASGRVSELSEDKLDSGGLEGYSLGASLRRLVITMSDFNKALFGSSDNKSGLQQMLDGLTALLNLINKLIRPFLALIELSKAFANNAPGANYKAPDWIQNLNLNTVPNFLLTPQQQSQKNQMNSAASFNVTIYGALDPASSARAVQQVLTNGTRLGVI